MLEWRLRLCRRCVAGTGHAGSHCCQGWHIGPDGAAGFCPYLSFWVPAVQLGC